MAKVGWTVPASPSQKVVVRPTRVQELQEPTPDAACAVPARYTDVHQYNMVFKLLVKLEADYDRAMKESQARAC